MTYSANDLSCFGQSELIGEILKLQEENKQLKIKLKGEIKQ